jgi:hypothetical protein
LWVTFKEVQETSGIKTLYFLAYQNNVFSWLSKHCIFLRITPIFVKMQTLPKLKSNNTEILKCIFVFPQFILIFVCYVTRWVCMLCIMFIEACNYVLWHSWLVLYVFFQYYFVGVLMKFNICINVLAIFDRVYFQCFSNLNTKNNMQNLTECISSLNSKNNSAWLQHIFVITATPQN